ncbi:protein kinase domain-containing protein [Streptomyces drozdowiczii]|uniref:Protein kinase n=1 Tax=Streptomyces drozdowiczii TaxID=202862 RepID=A0ABY6PUF3_9ACTN|nr:protein kinase [Streptomyces drozdowiczii]MCX0244350.1 protein kinase [Streptomyces drozdowiczii]UZK55860.1 protein kinase [Streptomyces drozdowiczii]
MGQGPPPPTEAVALLAGHTGTPGAIQLLSDRRGSRVWKVQGPGGAVAVKANDPDGDNAHEKAAEMAQEDDHLLRLTAAGAVSPDYRVGAGPWEGGRWLAVNWIDGVPLWQALALAREPEGDRATVRSWLTGIARSWTERLARMHAAGWAHADVQPTNTLVTSDGRAAVIDYALACGPGDRRAVPYRGALTHTTAPEIATAILSTPAGIHIQAHPAADIWSLGASLFWCWTGHRPVPYDETTDRLEKLAAIAKGTTTALRDVRPWLFPAFEDAITACLAADPSDRPTAEELTTAW